MGVFAAVGAVGSEGRGYRRGGLVTSDIAAGCRITGTGLSLAEAEHSGGVAAGVFCRGMLMKTAGRCGQVATMMRPLPITDVEPDADMGWLSDSVRALVGL